MNEACRQFDSLIARAGQLALAETSRLEAHLAGCESCRELARLIEPVAADVAFAATNASEPLAGAELAGPGEGPPRLATDRYRITGEVGRGGIGRVLRAQDRVLDRSVALKELLTADDGTRKRFIREALITARLQHPSIVPVYDAGHRADQAPFYAMKLLAGWPLDKSVADASTLTERLALLPAVLAIADAMAYAHSERIIHRDLKPTNVLVGNYGETVVIDWGLAKDLAIEDLDALDAGPYRAAGLDRTVAGTLLGTPAYMAPEQAAGEPVDERADVYAIGAILYHVIAGTAPHEGNTLEEMVDRIVSGEVRPLTERVPEVPRDLAAIVGKAMALDRSERYRGAQGLADDLRRYLTGQLVASHTYGTRELLRRWVKRHRAAVTVGAAAVLVVGVIGVASILRIVHAREQADAAAAEAMRERNRTTEMLADMFVEQGRAELVAGRPARAAVYLSEAQRRTKNPGVSLRSLLAEALRSVEAERRSFEGHTGELHTAAFSSDGTRIATAGLGETATVWDAAAGTAVATLSGHHGGIKSIAFSPDRTRIVTASRDETARLWDARSGRLLATLTHPDEVGAAVFSPDGARIVTAGGEGAIRLWDAASFRMIASLNGHRQRVYTAAFRPDGARIVTASGDGTAKVWDGTTGKLIRTLAGHHDEVEMAAWSPDGALILTAGADTTARLWDAETGRALHSLEGHHGPLSLAVFSPDGARVATASADHTARLWRVRSGVLLRSLVGHAAEVRTAAFSPDGERLVTASYDHTAKLWDCQTGSLLASFESHRDGVETASFSPDGKSIVTASWDGTAKLWDAASNIDRVPLGGPHGLASAVLSRDGARVVTKSEDDPVARVWDVRSGKLVAVLEGHAEDIATVGLDAAGARAVTAGFDTTARVWDVATGKSIATLPHDDAVRGAAISPDGASAVTLVRAGARLWNAGTGAPIATLVGIDDVLAVNFTPDGARLLTGSIDGTAAIWRTDRGTLVARLEGHTGPIHSIVASADGRRVVTAGQDHGAKVWDAATGELLASLDGHTEFVRRAVFSPDGERVVTSSGDYTAKVWDSRTGKLLGSLDGHRGEVMGARFSPDGARVATVSADHTVKLWDTQTGRLLATLDCGVDARDMMFTPDGSRLALASEDGSRWLWDIHLEERDAEAIRRIVEARDPWTLANGALVPVLVR